MSILITCPHCHESFTLKDQFAGQRGACPKCRGAIDVPADAPRVSASSQVRANTQASYSTSRTVPPERKPRQFRRPATPWRDTVEPERAEIAVGSMLDELPAQGVVPEHSRLIQERWQRLLRRLKIGIVILLAIPLVWVVTSLVWQSIPWDDLRRELGIEEPAEPAADSEKSLDSQDAPAADAKSNDRAAQATPPDRSLWASSNKSDIDLVHLWFAPENWSSPAPRCAAT